MIEETIMSLFSGHLNSLARNKLFHWFINSEAAYRLLEWQVSKYTKLLREPTNGNILAALGRLERFASSLTPNGSDRVFESGAIGALRKEFESAVETGKDTNLTRKAKRTIGLMGRKYLKTVLLDFGIIRFGVGNLNRRHLGEGVPYLNLIAVQVNSKCTTSPRCPGCFAKKDGGELDYETLDRVVGESIALTSRATVILGGEPLLRKKDLIQLFSKYDRMTFWVFTNGKLLDSEYAEKVAGLGNVMHLINIPGLEPTATKLRGMGVWHEISLAAENLRKNNAAVGFTSTANQTNFYELSSPEFVEKMVEFGMMVGFYWPYKTPVGCSPETGLALSPEMSDEFSRRVRDASARYPLILVDTTKGEEKLGGCLAAKGSAVYVRSDGTVAVCPWVPQSNVELDVGTRPLEKILLSPYFEFVRSHGKGQKCFVESPDFLARLPEYVR